MYEYPLADCARVTVLAELNRDPGHGGWSSRWLVVSTAGSFTADCAVVGVLQRHATAYARVRMCVDACAFTLVLTQAIMDKEEFTLEDLLNEEDIIQECKTANSRLVQ